ncbi:DUF1127 domain-containing protein [Celerinatantimonas yamalensis]|uniref:DUF1127 domain-containing protein n=1 Tax=Celerinatantimonas yamalensis TaxID=559956 RepID=A0ABW9G8P3_9GAMM
MTTRIAHVERRNQSANNLKQFIQIASNMMNHWHERQRTRQHLDDMPAYLLRDIGLDEQQRQQELAKHFWQR